MHTHDTVQPTPVVQPSKGLSLAALAIDRAGHLRRVRPSDGCNDVPSNLLMWRPKVKY